MIADAIERIALRAMAFVRFYPIFACVVEAQNPDGTLELTPDAAFLKPGLSNVPMRTFGPGVTLQVAKGSRVGIQFDNGLRGSPKAVLFEPGFGSTVSLTVNAPVVNIGAANPTDAAALASKVLARLQAIETAFNSHTHVVPALPVPNAVPAGAGPVTAGPGATASGLPQVSPASTDVSSTNLLLKQ